MGFSHELPKSTLNAVLIMYDFAVLWLIVFIAQPVLRLTASWCKALQIGNLPADVKPCSLVSLRVFHCKEGSHHPRHLIHSDMNCCKMWLEHARCYNVEPILALAFCRMTLGGGKLQKPSSSGHTAAFLRLYCSPGISLTLH